MPASQKKQFEDSAAKDKERYDKEVCTWVQLFTPPPPNLFTRPTVLFTCGEVHEDDLGRVVEYLIYRVCYAKHGFVMKFKVINIFTFDLCCNFFYFGEFFSAA